MFSSWCIWGCKSPAWPSPTPTTWPSAWATPTAASTPSSIWSKARPSGSSSSEPSTRFFERATWTPAASAGAACAWGWCLSRRKPLQRWCRPRWTRNSYNSSKTSPPWMDNPPSAASTNTAAFGCQVPVVAFAAVERRPYGTNLLLRRKWSRSPLREERFQKGATMLIWTQEQSQCSKQKMAASLAWSVCGASLTLVMRFFLSPVFSWQMRRCFEIVVIFVKFLIDVWCYICL